MKKKINSLTIIILLALIIIYVFTNSKNITTAIFESYELFLKNIFPSLFPMFIISYILVEIKIPEVLGNIFKKPFYKLFKTKKEASFVFFMSMLTGFPSSAKYIESLMNKNLLDEKDANKILQFTFFSNPLFIINTVGIMFLNNIKLGYIILISHITGNIITGLIFRNYNKKEEPEKENIKQSIRELIIKINTTKFFNVLLNAIKDALSTMILIFGILVTFQIIITMMPKSTIIKGLIEMTIGLKYTSLLTNTNLKLILSTFFLSFGGLCIHTQIMNILNKKRVKYLPFLLARINHGITSSIIAITITLIWGA